MMFDIGTCASSEALVADAVPPAGGESVDASRTTASAGNHFFRVTWGW